MLSMLLSQRAEEDILYIFYNETDQVLLTRNDAVADALAGSWGAKGSSGMCSLTLNPDRTVSGNIDGEFEGTWQLMPVQEQELIGSYCGMSALNEMARRSS